MNELKQKKNLNEVKPVLINKSDSIKTIKIFDIVKEKSKNDPIDIFKKALNNASPHVEVKSKRIGGATYQVPIEVPSRRQFYLASQWIIDSAKKRSGSSMSSRLAGEILSASNNEGSAIKKKEDTHRMAEANKAFAHFGRGR